MEFPVPKNLGRNAMLIFFLSSTLILGFFTKATGQSSKPTPTKSFLDLSKLSDEQWVKEMDGLFNLLRFLYGEDELQMMKAQTGLTNEQMEAFKKYQAAFTHTSTAAKSSTMAESGLSTQERERRGEERYKKALEEQIRQAHTLRKILGSKDIDLREWGLESGSIFVSLTNALEGRKKKTDYADPDKFSDYAIKKITSSDFYQDYLSRKKAEFHNDADFNSFVSRHELQLKDRAAVEACNQSGQFIGIKNKTSLKNLSTKRKEFFQKLMAD